MGDASATQDKTAEDRGLSDDSRATGRASRGLDEAIAGHSRRRAEQPLLDREALEEELRRSREKAERVQRREAEAARRRRPADEVRIKPASRDPFGAREIGTENVPEPSRDSGPQRSGIPLSPGGMPDLELEAALAEILKRRGAAPKGARGRKTIELRDLFSTIPKETQEQILAALRTPRALPKIEPAKAFSLQEGIRLLGRTKVGALRRAGAKIHPKYSDDLPLNNESLNTTIYYVGPGVGVLFTPTGEMVEFPFGVSFEVEAVHEWAKEGGMFFSFSPRETVRLYPEPEYKETFFRVKTAGPLREWREIEWYTNDRAILFIVSPSYFKRRGFRAALTGLPGRAWDAASLAVKCDYLLYAAGDQAKKVQNMDGGDIARMIVELAVDVLSPFPSYEDIQDQMRLGRANIMAMWGAGGKHINSDLDIAARLYSREVAAQILGIGFRIARKITKKIDVKARKGAGVAQVDAKGRGAETSEPSQPAVRAKQPDQRSLEVDSRGARRGESDLSPEGRARAERLAEEELRQGISRRPDDQAGTSERALEEPVQRRDRGTEASGKEREQVEAPGADTRPRRSTLDEEVLDEADTVRTIADEYWDELSKTGQKRAVAVSDGQYPTQSGYSYKKRKKAEPERKAPTSENESAYYVRRYKELSGKEPPRGRDLEGAEYAAHAEIKNRVQQSEDGTNTPTGVSRDMCGNCRRWHRDTAEQRGERIVVADPNYTRAFNPDGTVDIYDVNGRLVRTVPAGTEPAAGVKQNYEGVDW